MWEEVSPFIRYSAAYGLRRLQKSVNDAPQKPELFFPQNSLPLCRNSPSICTARSHPSPIHTLATCTLTPACVCRVPFAPAPSPARLAQAEVSEWSEFVASLQCSPKGGVGRIVEHGHGCGREGLHLRGVVCDCAREAAQVGMAG